MTRVLLAALALIALAAPAHAHRQPEVETTVEVLAGTVPSLGITHRLHAHDALTLLRALGVAEPDLMAADQLARLAAYAAGALELTGEATSDALGAEVEGDYVFVYVQHPEVAGVVGSRLLDGAVPGWTNTVHAKGATGETLRSVTFHARAARLGEGVPPIVPGGLGAAPTGTAVHDGPVDGAPAP